MIATMNTFVVIFLMSLATATEGLISDDAVTFHTFTAENSQESIPVSKQNVSINKDATVAFIVHGYLGNRHQSWYDELKNAFLARSNNTQVIQVDWHAAASQFYPVSAINTILVGKAIAAFILALVQNQNVSVKNIHLCGHSLGAHVAGFAGKSLLKQSLRLGRITALDPAGPLFEGFFASETRRLNKDDADIVVVVHTDRYKFGFAKSLGAIDFFPNGGTSSQPGCPDFANRNVLVCSHDRSHQYFVDALRRPQTFVGFLCPNYDEYISWSCDESKYLDLGGEFRVGDEGDYYLTTNAKSPYGQGAIKRS